MIDVSKYIIEIKDFEKQAKIIAGLYPTYSFESKSLSAVLAFMTKYWNCAEQSIKNIIEFNKPSQISKYVNGLSKGITACPLLFLEDSKGRPALSYYKVVKAIDRCAPPIRSKNGRVVKQYKTDQNGVLIMEPELKKISSWSIRIIFEVLLQNLFFCSILNSEGINIEEQMRIIRRKLSSPSNPASKNNKTIKEKSQFIRIIYTPMGNKR